jgi:hypothetical protein
MTDPSVRICQITSIKDPKERLKALYKESQRLYYGLRRDHERALESRIVMSREETAAREAMIVWLDKEVERVGDMIAALVEEIGPLTTEEIPPWWSFREEEPDFLKEKIKRLEAELEEAKADAAKPDAAGKN